MLVTKGLYRLVIWYNPNKKIYYHKLLRGFREQYKIGNENSYGHVIVDVIDLQFYIEKPCKLFFKRLLRKLISFLEKKERRLWTWEI